MAVLSWLPTPGGALPSGERTVDPLQHSGESLVHIQEVLNRIDFHLTSKAVPVTQEAPPGLNWQSFGQGLGAMAGARTPTASLGSGLHALGGLFGATPAGAVFKFEAALAHSVDRIREFAQSLISANLHFAEFSTAMGLVQAQQQIYNVQRAQRRGAMLAPSTRELVESLESLNKTMEPIQNAFDILLAKGTAKTVSALEELIKLGLATQPLLVSLIVYLNSLSKEKPGGLEEFIERQANDWATTHGLPGRFRGPP